MKAIKYFTALAALTLATLVAVSCAEAEPEAVHSDNTIQAIYINRIHTDGTTMGASIAGEINDQTGEVYFIIPKRQQATWEPEIPRLKVSATVGLDVRITPSLSGLKDLSSPLTITATSGTGVSRNYTLFVEIEL